MYMKISCWEECSFLEKRSFSLKKKHIHVVGVILFYCMTKGTHHRTTNMISRNKRRIIISPSDRLLTYLPKLRFSMYSMSLAILVTDKIQGKKGCSVDCLRFALPQHFYPTSIHKTVLYSRREVSTLDCNLYIKVRLSAWEVALLNSLFCRDVRGQWKRVGDVKPSV